MTYTNETIDFFSGWNDAPKSTGCTMPTTIPNETKELIIGCAHNPPYSIGASSTHSHLLSVAAPNVTSLPDNSCITMNNVGNLFAAPAPESSLWELNNEVETLKSTITKMKLQLEAMTEPKISIRPNSMFQISDLVSSASIEQSNTSASTKPSSRTKRAMHSPEYYSPVDKVLTDYQLQRDVQAAMLAPGTTMMVSGALWYRLGDDNNNNSSDDDDYERAMGLVE